MVECWNVSAMGRSLDSVILTARTQSICSRIYFYFIIPTLSKQALLSQGHSPAPEEPLGHCWQYCWAGLRAVSNTHKVPQCLVPTLPRHSHRNVILWSFQGKSSKVSILPSRPNVLRWPSKLKSKPDVPTLPGCIHRLCKQQDHYSHSSAWCSTQRHTKWANLDTGRKQPWKHVQHQQVSKLHLERRGK